MVTATQKKTAKNVTIMGGSGVLITLLFFGVFNAMDTSGVYTCNDTMPMFAMKCDSIDKNYCMSKVQGNVYCSKGWKPFVKIEPVIKNNTALIIHCTPTGCK